MNIDQFRVVVRAKEFDRTCHFYGGIMALPRLRSWDHEEGRGALFQAGPGVIEVRGLPAGREEDAGEFLYQGPDHKLVITLLVPSAEQAYEELQFRQRNIPGGLHRDEDGSTVFETHDPDGVKILFREIH